MLGDYWPDTLKNAHITSRLTPGRVLYLDVTFTTPHKTKFLVLVCVEGQLLFFVINSEINAYKHMRPELLGAQLSIRAVDYSFLDHDSYVDCSQVIYSLGEAEVRAQLLRDLSGLKDELSTADKQRIIAIVQTSRTISKVHKRLILSALQNS